MRHEFQFAMPPVGVTRTLIQLGGETFEKFTVRCDADGCWMVAHSRPSVADAERFLDAHKNGTPYPNGERGWSRCPTWPLRESLPSGLREVQKLWNELDDVVDALTDGTAYRDMSADVLKGYAQGLSFSIIMKEGVYFPHLAAVAAHARDRRRMRAGEIEWKETPSVRSDTNTVYSSGEFFTSTVPAKAVSPVAQGNSAASVRSTTRGRPATAATKAPLAKVTVASLDPSVVEGIRGAAKSGLFSHGDLAETFKVPESLIKEIVG